MTNITLKDAVDQLAGIRKVKSSIEKEEKELTAFIKANMSGITAYGVEFKAILSAQIRRVLDQSLIPAEAIELYKVDKTIEILKIEAR